MPKRFQLAPTAGGTGEPEYDDEFSLTREQRWLAAQSANLAKRKAGRDPAENEKQTRTARKLFDSALLLTRHLGSILVSRPDIIRAISKEYSYFPVALPGAKGGGAKTILAAVHALPIGKNGPFKISQGRQKSDAKREAILLAWRRIMSKKPDSPPISRKNSRFWAKEVISQMRTLEAGGLKVNPAIFSADPSAKTGTRKRKKVERLKDLFEVKRIRKVTGPSRDIQYSTDNELDPIKATKFQERMKKAEETKTNQGDKDEALVDCYDKRIRSMLK
jgi:hypothetical protein